MTARPKVYGTRLRVAANGARLTDSDESPRLAARARAARRRAAGGRGRGRGCAPRRRRYRRPRACAAGHCVRSSVGGSSCMACDTSARRGSSTGLTMRAKKRPGTQCRPRPTRHNCAWAASRPGNVPLRRAPRLRLPSNASRWWKRPHCCAPRARVGLTAVLLRRHSARG